MKKTLHATHTMTYEALKSLMRYGVRDEQEAAAWAFEYVWRIITSQDGFDITQGFTVTVKQKIEEDQWSCTYPNCMDGSDVSYSGCNGPCV